MAQPIGPDVLALFEDSMTAHQAILALERSGIEGGEIRIVGDATVLGPHEMTQRADRALERDVGARAVIGAGFGALVGAVAALLVVVLVDDVAFGAVIGGALFAGSVGALLGTFTRLGASDAWADTLAADDSASVVAVTSNDITVLERAADLLAHADGLQRIVMVGGPRE
jgi:hypothetical protein